MSILNVEPGMLEADFQSEVIRLADSQGWKYYHTYDSRKSTTGFPDLVLARGNFCIIKELKRDSKQKPTPAQIEWIEALRKVDKKICGFWIPEQAEEIVKTLMEKGR